MFEILIVLAIGLVVGWIARVYFERHYPDETAMLDTVATKYGEAAATNLSNAMRDAQAKGDGKS